MEEEITDKVVSDKEIEQEAKNNNDNIIENPNENTINKDNNTNDPITEINPKANQEDTIMNNNNNNVPEINELDKPQYSSKEIQTDPEDKAKEEEYNNNIKQANDSIRNLVIRLEIESLFSNSYQLQTKTLQNKIQLMKSGIQELHSKFEIELNKKDKTCMDKLFSITKQTEDLKKREADYIKTIRVIDEMNKTLKANLSSISKEKMDLEDVIFRQEDKLSIIANRVNQIEQVLLKKNRIIKENEAYALELIAIVEEQKKEIKTLKGKLKGDMGGFHYQDNNDLVIQIQNLKKELEEKNKRIRLYEADTSAIYLKSGGNNNSNSNSNNINQLREAYDDGGYNDVIVSGGRGSGSGIGIGIEMKNRSVENLVINNGNYDRSNNDNSNIHSGNSNNSQLHLPKIAVKNSHHDEREQLNEFKSIMNQLIDEINE